MKPDAMPDCHWRCDCGGGHFLTLRWDPGDARAGAELEGYLDVEGDSRTPVRDRIAEAWRLLRHGCAQTRVGVILDRGKAGSVIAALQAYLADTAAADSPLDVESAAQVHPAEQAALAGPVVRAARPESP